MSRILISVFTVMLFLGVLGQNLPKNKNKVDQEGLRQETWTLMLNRNFQEIGDPGQLAYYRIISYLDDHPQGITRDHYPSGQVMWEGRLLADRPELVMDGDVTWYDKEGTKVVTRTFEAGKVLQQVFYESDGSSRETDSGTPSWQELSKKGVEAYRAGQLSLASQYLEEALQKAEKKIGTSAAGYGQVMSNLATVYAAQGLIDKSNPLFSRSIEIKRQAFGTEDERYGLALMQAGEIYFQHGHLYYAEQYILSALKVYQSSIGTENKFYAYGLTNMGILYSRARKLGLAKSYLNQARKVIQTSVGTLDREYADVLVALGNVFMKLEQYDSAAKVYHRAAINRQIVLGKSIRITSKFKRSWQHYTIRWDFMLRQKNTTSNNTMDLKPLYRPTTSTSQRRKEHSSYNKPNLNLSSSNRMSFATRRKSPKS